MFGRLAMGFASVRAGTLESTKMLVLVLVQASMSLPDLGRLPFSQAST